MYFIWRLMYIYVVHMKTYVHLYTLYEDLCTFMYFIWRLMYIYVLHMKSYVHLCTSYEDLCTFIHFIWSLMYIYVLHMKTYVLESPTCPCGTTEQTIDHLLFQCELLGKEMDKLISGISKTDNWPLSKNRLISEHLQPFSKFIHEISLEKLNEMYILYYNNL